MFDFNSIPILIKELEQSNYVFYPTIGYEGLTLYTHSDPTPNQIESTVLHLLPTKEVKEIYAKGTRLNQDPESDTYTSNTLSTILQAHTVISTLFSIESPKYQLKLLKIWNHNYKLPTKETLNSNLTIKAEKLLQPINIKDLKLFSKEQSNTPYFSNITLLNL